MDAIRVTLPKPDITRTYRNTRSQVYTVGKPTKQYGDNSITDSNNTLYPPIYIPINRHSKHAKQPLPDDSDTNAKPDTNAR